MQADKPTFNINNTHQKCILQPYNCQVLPNPFPRPRFGGSGGVWGVLGGLGGNNHWGGESAMTHNPYNPCTLRCMSIMRRSCPVPKEEATKLRLRGERLELQNRNQELQKQLAILGRTKSFVVTPNSLCFSSVSWTFSNSHT